MALAPKQHSPQHRQSAPIEFLIGVGKLIKAASLIAVGIGAHDLLGKDVTVRITQWVRAVHADPDNRFIHSLLVRIVALTPAQLEELSVGTFLYATLFLVEGIGLILHKHWAEWLTVATTAILLPLEVYALTREFTLVRIAILLINMGIVWYLIDRLRSSRRDARE